MPKLSFNKWKDEAQKFLYKELGLEDLWDPSNPYDIGPDVDWNAFRHNQTPEAFIRWFFEEDFNNKANDELLLEQSIEAEETRDCEEDYFRDV
jgi:hypothetical protein